MGIINGMIKINQLLKESLATYKKNFKNITIISLPILALGLLGLSVSVFKNPLLVVLFGFISALGGLFTSLYFQPIVLRSVQKAIDTNVFDKKDAYAFQNKNIWNWIVLNFWTAVYSLYKVYKLIIPAVVLIMVGIYYMMQKNIPMAVGFYVVAGILILIAALLNAPRFLVAQNIFFSKGEKPRDAVRASIALGEKNTRDMWRVILTMIVFGIYVAIAYVVLFGLAMLSGLVTMADLESSRQAVDPSAAYVLMNAFSYVVSTLLVTPATFVILALGYNKIKGTSSESNPQ
jgi:hypothetical protein